MNSLIVMLDRAAPSFCYYESAPADDKMVMAPEVFEDVLAFAEKRALSLQLLCGQAGLPDYAPPLLEGRPFICYFPPGAPGMESEDVPLLEVVDFEVFARVPAGRHVIAVLRVTQKELNRLPEIWRFLREPLPGPDVAEDAAGRVRRVVLVLPGLDRYDEAALETYRAALNNLRGELEGAYLDGFSLELNALSDRLTLGAPRHCNAGVEHLTVDESGQLHICPGFALDGEPAIGDLESGPDLPNGQLLRLDHAPICSVCDAFHCRRCVYLNQRATLELNTPPWQLCRASHLEREASRVLLARLKEHGLLRQLPVIPEIEYDDPLQKMLDSMKRKRPEANRKKERTKGPGSEAGGPTKEKKHSRPDKSGTGGPTKEDKYSMFDKSGAGQGPIGKVTEGERDRIRELHFRKSGLNELFLTLTKADRQTLDSTPLYDKIVRDMGMASQEFQAWWDSMAQKYRWPPSGKGWRIDFDTCEIFPA